jgi:hypothetical protein
LVIAAFLAMTAGPLFAAPSHEVCDAMRHGCTKIDALASCCCGDPSDSNPSQVAADRTLARADSTDSVAIVPVTSGLPAVAISFVHEALPSFARPPDLPILFSDLRL